MITILIVQVLQGSAHSLRVRQIGWQEINRLSGFRKDAEIAANVNEILNFQTFFFGNHCTDYTQIQTGFQADKLFKTRFLEASTV